MDVSGEVSEEVTLRDEIAQLKQLIVAQDQAYKAQAGMIADLTKQIGAMSGQMAQVQPAPAAPKKSPQDIAFEAVLAQYGVNIKKED